MREMNSVGEIRTMQMRDACSRDFDAMDDANFSRIRGML